LNWYVKAEAFFLLRCHTIHAIADDSIPPVLSQRDLVEADEKVIVRETVSENQKFVELVWRERLPLGMNLLMNDESGQLKVVDFPRGSQARLVCEKRGYDPELFKGARLVAVNGFEYDDQDELFDALKDPSRPKTVQFELASEVDAERVRKFVEGSSSAQKSADQEEQSGESEREYKLRDFVFDQLGEVGIEFSSSLDYFGLVVRGFMEGDGGIVLAAERSGKVTVGDLLIKINGELAISTDGGGKTQAFKLLEKAADIRPLCLTFARPYLYREIIETPPGTTNASSDGGPSELVLGEQTLDEDGSKRIVLKGFEHISGKAESSGILIGDHLVFVNGLPVGAGCRWLGVSPSPTLAEVNEMLKTEASYPMGLTFARPRQDVDGGGRWSPVRSHAIADDECDTTCVTVDRCGQLGCVFEQKRNSDIQVVDFESVPGVFQLAMRKHRDPNTDKLRYLSVDSLNGQFVPSYATKDMVKNAISRSWKSDGRVEMWLCDDRQKRWIHQIAKS